MIILLRFSHHSIFDQSRQRWTLAKSVAWKDDSLSSIISPKLDRITLQSPKTYAPKGPKVGKQSLRIGIKMTKRWRKRCLTNPWRRTSAFGESEERLEEVLECGKWVSVESDSVSSFSSSLSKATRMLLVVFGRCLYFLCWRHQPIQPHPVSVTPAARSYVDRNALKRLKYAEVCWCYSIIPANNRNAMGKGILMLKGIRQGFGYVPHNHLPETFRP